MFGASFCGQAGPFSGPFAIKSSTNSIGGDSEETQTYSADEDDGSRRPASASAAPIAPARKSWLLGLNGFLGQARL